MVQKFEPCGKDDEVKIRMDITVDLPVELAKQAERLGIYEFDSCVLDSDAHRMTASVTTVFSRKGA